MRVQPLFTFGKIDNIQGARVGGRGEDRFLWILFQSILKHGKKLERWWADGGGIEQPREVGCKRAKLASRKSKGRN
jgi:hypothetical protein